MRINIIFPYNNVGGAFRSTYELSNNLINKGHDVTVYVPFFPYLEGRNFFSKEGFKIFIRGIGKSLIRRNIVSWFDLKAQYKVVPLIKNFFVRDADIIIANHWQTVSDVFKLNSCKGLKFNFIRDTNPWMYKPELEISSFKEDLFRIVVSPWLKDFLEKELELEVEGVVQNGTNFNDFHYSKKSYQNPPTIGMVYYDHPQKGMDDGIEVLRRVKEVHPEVKVQIFGLSQPKPLPFEAAIYLRPDRYKLRELYGTSDIFLFPSIQEGSGNPPREAMVSGCALVTTNVGCIPECTIPGETAFIVEPGDRELMTRHVIGLIENPFLLKQTGKRAKNYIKNFTWENSASKLESILINKLKEAKKSEESI